MHRRFLVFSLLAATQILGWGTVGILPVTAARAAKDLGVDLAVVFLGTSVLFVTMGLAAPWAGRGFRRFGARRVMAAGALLIGVSLAVIAFAPSPEIFLAGWAITGFGGAMFLTTAAYVYLADCGDERARGLIGSLMLVTGLAGSVFWPVTAFLDGLYGWRVTVLIYAAVMVLLVSPAVVFGLPETGAAANREKTANRPERGRDRIFLLVVLIIVLNGFATFGIESVGIELFRALGTDLARAVAIASLLGIFKVGGRVIDLLGGRNWDGLSTALVSGATIPLGLMAVAFWGASVWAVAGYLCLFGLGSGAFAVARATMPLVFYRKADYAIAMSAIALPMNLINALAPPALAALLVRTGPYEVLGLLAAISTAAFALLLYLNRLRDRATALEES